LEKAGRIFDGTFRGFRAIDRNQVFHINPSK
jgi:hypothetical protein